MSHTYKDVSEGAMTLPSPSLYCAVSGDALEEIRRLFGTGRQSSFVVTTTPSRLREQNPSLSLGVKVETDWFAIQQVPVSAPSKSFPSAEGPCPSKKASRSG